MMDLAELVVVGTYLGDNPDGKPYPGGCSCPMASGLVEFEKVLRGRYENGVIPFYYYGGQLLIRDAIEYAEKEGLDRKKYRIFEWLEKDDPGANVIIKGRGSSFVEPEKGSRYLIYLFYEPNVRQAYCVMEDQYGFRSVNEKNQIYDPDTKEFMDWKALQE